MLNSLADYNGLLNTRAGCERSKNSGKKGRYFLKLEEAGENSGTFGRYFPGETDQWPFFRGTWGNRAVFYRYLYEAGEKRTNSGKIYGYPER
ncbi:hypothetical protein [Paenibacillus sp. TH7-28]